MRSDQLSSECVLVIDLGTGGPKVGLVEVTGRILASGFERTSTFFLPNGGAEQDANEWWDSIRRVCKMVLAQAAVPVGRIVAVACTSQYSTTVAVDRTGDPLMNAITWMDTRGGIHNRRITRGFPMVEGYGLPRALRWVRLTGAIPTNSGVDALGHILFIKNERPDVYRRTFKFLEPMDYITMRLTGIAAATQSTVFPLALSDTRQIDGLDYDPKLIAISGIDPAKLPEMLPKQSIVGTLLPSVARDLGLSPEIAVITGAADVHTSILGSGAVHDYEGVVVLGSTAFLSCHVPFKKTNLSTFMTTLPSPLHGRYSLWGDLGSSGPRVLDSYLANLVFFGDALLNQELPQDMYVRMSLAAEGTTPGSDGVLFLPWFNGTLCPQEDAAMRGGFLNLSHKTTRAHLTRAVLEGIAYNSRWLMGAAEKFVGRHFPYLRLAGGGALSDAWAQIMADVLNVPIHQQADPRNGNVLGMAFLAFLRLGTLSLEDIPRRVAIAHVYDPRPENRDVYDLLFGQFMACQKNLKGVFHALNTP